MIPVGAIAVAVWLASRGLQNGNAPSGPPLPAAWLLVVLRWFAALVVWVVADELVRQHQAGEWLTTAALPVVAVLLAPTLLLEWALVPLGMPRAAYWWAFATAPVPTLRELAAGRSFYALRAALRQPSPDPRALALAERALDDNRPGPRNGLSVVASGLLAVARGDADHGRLLLASATRMKPPVVPGVVRRLAQRWLVADALARGDLDGAVREARQPRPALWPTLVADEIERRRGAKGFWRALRRPLLWAAAGPRLATRRFLQRLRGGATALPEATGDALVDALAAHRALLATTPRAGALAEACRRWDAAAASTAPRARVERRALALNATVDGAAAVSAFLGDVEGDLVGLAARLEEPLAELAGSALGERVLAAVRDRDLDEIEALADAFEAQTRRQDFPGPMECWALFARMRRQVERSLARHGEDLRPMFAEVVFHAVTNWNCRLYNDQVQHALGREVFLWVAEQTDPLPLKDWQLARNNAAVPWY